MGALTDRRLTGKWLHKGIGNGCKDRSIHGLGMYQIKKKMDGGIDRWTEGRMDGLMDKGIGGGKHMDGGMYI